MPKRTPFAKLVNSQVLMSVVMSYLDAHPEGFTEYDLICHLDEKSLFKALDSTLNTSLLIFQKHFIVFHVLYSISQHLVERSLGGVHISPMIIKKLPYVEADTQISKRDPLGEYYLDIQNLESATEGNVNDLLTSFWEQYLRNDKRGDALKVLGLSDPVSDREIVQRYRKLASTHHPDKGGEKHKIQEINEAYALLIKT